ncbi:uncharacterized protein LOC122378385 [Amphibalanus amphitrite]|uniref:uncharacterized protein LOC122378385 n=1 Tax=Amphibalanus amphitrite TaxID=1232801 RepID=UPI001C903466|nr:uncharacterized protein LOC122378385 [Amphibalanus amphitrite]
MDRGGSAALLQTVALLLVLTGGARAAAAVTSEAGLSCYQCNVTENSQCGPPQPCPTDQAYDRCSTTLQKQDDGPMRIIKGCTLGRCFLDSGATTALGLDRCDTSRPKFDCFFCCTGDACNVSSAPRVDIAAAKLIAVVLVTSLLTLL